MGGTLGKFLKGDFSGGFKDIVNSPVVKAVAPIALGAALGPAGFLGKAIGGLGFSAGTTDLITKAVGTMGAAAFQGGPPAGVSQADWQKAQQAYQQNPGAFSQTFMPQKGVGMDELIKLYALTSKDKPEAPDRLSMKDIGSNLSQLPFFSNMQNAVNNENMNKLGVDITGERSRVLGQELGYGDERTRAMKQNLTTDLDEAARVKNNALNASMANRGLSGGVMTTAQRAANSDYMDALQKGLNNINISNEEAIRGDRSQQNSDVAKLLGMSGDQINSQNSTTMDAFGKMMQGVGSNVDLYNAQLKGYETDSKAWGDMFNSMAQAGSQFQPSYNPNTGQQGQNFMGSAQPATDAAQWIGGMLKNPGQTLDTATGGYTNYFSNPSTGAGQKVTDFIKDPFGTMAGMFTGTGNSAPYTGGGAAGGMTAGVNPPGGSYLGNVVAQPGQTQPYVRDGGAMNSQVQNPSFNFMQPMTGGSVSQSPITSNFVNQQQVDRDAQSWINAPQYLRDMWSKSPTFNVPKDPKVYNSPAHVVRPGTFG